MRPSLWEKNLCKQPGPCPAIVHLAVGACVCALCMGIRVCACEGMPTFCLPSLTPLAGFSQTPQVSSLGFGRFPDLPRAVYSLTKYFLATQLSAGTPEWEHLEGPLSPQPAPCDSCEPCPHTAYPGFKNSCDGWAEENMTEAPAVSGAPGVPLPQGLTPPHPWGAPTKVWTQILSLPCSLLPHQAARTLLGAGARAW